MPAIRSHHWPSSLSCSPPERPTERLALSRLLSKFATQPDELLDGEIFYTLKEARIIVESWRRHYNTVRPHGSLGYKPPAPEVFIPAFARAALQPQPAMPPALAPRPSLH